MSENQSAFFKKRQSKQISIKSEKSNKFFSNKYIIIYTIYKTIILTHDTYFLNKKITFYHNSYHFYFTINRYQILICK